MSTANEHLTSGYAGEAARDRRRRKLRAADFRFNADMEKLAQMRDEAPDRFDRLPPTSRTALGYYENSKAAAQAEGIETDRP